MGGVAYKIAGLNGLAELWVDTLPDAKHSQLGMKAKIEACQARNYLQLLPCLRDDDRRVSSRQTPS